MSKQMLNAADLMNILGVSRSKAYEIIKNLNKELEAKGYITMPGKVPAGYVEERFYSVTASSVSQNRPHDLFVVQGG